MAKAASFGVFLERFLEPALASGPAALASIDLLQFRELNDDFGPAAGDAVLEAVQRCLVDNLPAKAVVTRKGGDEYAVLFPGTLPEDALILMQEVREHLSGHPVVPEVDRPVGVRIGIAGSPAHAGDARSLMHAADDALVRAKEQGSHVAIYVEERMVMKSNYYAKGQLSRLARLARRSGRTEASLLREALDDVLAKYADR